MNAGAEKGAKMKKQMKYDIPPPKPNRTGASNLNQNQVGRSLFICSTNLYRIKGNHWILDDEILGFQILAKRQENEKRTEKQAWAADHTMTVSWWRCCHGCKIKMTAKYILCMFCHRRNGGMCRTHHAQKHRTGGRKDKPPPRLHTCFINRNAKQLSQKMREKFGIFHYAPSLNPLNGTGCRSPPGQIESFKIQTDLEIIKVKTPRKVFIL